MDNIMAFFNSVIQAEFNFEAMWNFIKSFFDSLFANGDISGMINYCKEALASYELIVAIAMVVFAAIILLFGKKLFPLLRFLAVFAIGYGVGVLYVSPLINGIIAMPTYVSGLVIGLVAAVLSKFVYFVLVFVAAAYSGYMFAFSGEYLPQITSFTKGSMVFSAVVAVVAVILVFILLKLIEMAGTAFLGAYWLSSLVVANFFDYTSLIPGAETIVMWVAIGVVALVGFIVQFKTRTRY